MKKFNSLGKLLTRYEQKKIVGGDEYDEDEYGDDGGGDFCCSVKVTKNGEVVENCEESTTQGAKDYCKSLSSDYRCSYSCGDWKCGTP